MAQSPSYFVDHKRGEVNELRALLRNPRLQKEPARKREVIKKVIAYMTLGIDVSKIFNEMVMASYTKDPVQKKMVYLYLCTYAEQKADLAIMAINTLLKDAKDEDPMVRGLALRSLCSLRLPNILEYVLQPIRQRLADPSSYVRKTAVIGVAKLFTRHPQAVKESDLVDVLYNMLRDKDAVVVTNTIYALNEILADEGGGMAINQQIIMHLLNRMADFNEWGQCAVLDLTARYTPASPQEMFDVMNLLEDRLKHANSAVVLATTKVFLNFTANTPKIHHKVYQRLKSPLLTLIGSQSTELAYAVLSHVATLVSRAPGVFDDQFKHFYVRYNDPSCNKLLKLNVLQELANDKNFSEIIAEFSEYVTDVDAEFARNAIKSIGSIAIRIDAAADESIEHLLSFLDLQMDYVSAETCIVLKNLLRKYPERYEEVIPAIQKVLKTIDEEAGKVAVIWMIGEYGDTIKDAPYILEPLIDAFAEESSHAVRLELLTATMKLFFKRPPELKGMLGRLLSSAVSDTLQVDVRDRALLYYRLLQFDVHEAARVVNCPKVIVEHFAEQEDVELKDQVFNEFNSLSVVYGKPAKSFVTGYTGTELMEADKPKDTSDSSAPLRGADAEGGDSSNTEQKRDDGGVPGGVQKEVDLLSLEMGEDLPTVKAPMQPQLDLNPSAVIDVATFQNKWAALPEIGRMQLRLLGADDAQRIESLLLQKNILIMASGKVGQVWKFYFFAQETGTAMLYLIECVVDTESGQMSITVKGDPSADADTLLAMFRGALEDLL